MRIGEKQSELVDMKEVIFTPSGEAYASHLMFIVDKPLDTGRLLYARLRNALPRNVDVEVLWDHFHDEVTALISTDELEREVSFRDPILPRAELVLYINRIVDSAKEMEQFLQPPS